MNDSVIVYRSRAEQATDELLWSVVENNPQFFLKLFGVFVGATVILMIFIAVKTFLAFRDSKKKPWHHR
jgi:hypothetical protein